MRVFTGYFLNVDHSWFPTRSRYAQFLPKPMHLVQSVTELHFVIFVQSLPRSSIFVFLLLANRSTVKKNGTRKEISQPKNRVTRVYFKGKYTDRTQYTL